MPDGTPSSRAAQRLKNAQTPAYLANFKLITANYTAFSGVCRQDDGVPFLSNIDVNLSKELLLCFCLCLGAWMARAQYRIDQWTADDDFGAEAGATVKTAERQLGRPED